MAGSFSDMLTAVSNPGTTWLQAAAARVRLDTKGRYVSDRRIYKNEDRGRGERASTVDGLSVCMDGLYMVGCPDSPLPLDKTNELVVV